ncbi:MAG TPA: Uma2 family endonuclease [Bryobacteraceae bacterium]|nr:Uma2 family endonuclease [Bryobacteraceae bacterium]
MATGTTLVSVEEYLASTHKPAYEYLEGILREKPMPTSGHSRMEKRLSLLIDDRNCGYEAFPELTVRISRSRFLVPDIAVQRTDDLQEPYPTRPVHLCIEILSPEDRLADVVVKCDDYHRWGTPYCWIIDPEEKTCWEYHSGGRPHPVAEGGQISAGEISLELDDVFASL